VRDIATAQLSGNLTRDVELRALPSGADVASLRVAFTTRRRQGEEWVDKTNYMTVDVFGAQARACAQYLARGSRVFVDAELDWREWDHQNGQRREAVTLKARQVLFEGARAQNGASQQAAAQTPQTITPPPGAHAPAAHAATAATVPPTAAPAAPGNGTATEDDLPF
jgi:single-strand DNA-binding protein